MVKIPTGSNGQFVAINANDVESVSRDTAISCRIRTKSGVTHSVPRKVDEILKAFNITAKWYDEKETPKSK